MHSRCEAKMWAIVPVFGALLLAVVSMSGAFAAEGEADAPAPVAPVLESQPQQIPEIVAKVDGEEITGEELQQAMMTAMRMKAARAASDPNRDPAQAPEQLDREDAERVLQSLIRGKVVYVLAKKAETAITDDEVNAEFAKVKESMPEGQLEQIMEARGITEDELKGKMREQLICQKFFDEKTKDITVTDDEVKQAYEGLKEAGRLSKPETADVAHILILAPRDGSEEDIAEAKKRIDAARDRVVNGKEDFGEVAKEVSEDESSAPRGGAFEDVPHERMVAEFDKLMFELPIGEVSEPFQTRYGWHIMKVSERDPARTLEFEEIHDDIRNAAETRAKNRAFNEFLEKAIADVNIEILLPKKEDAAVAPDAPAGAPEGASETAEEPELPDEPS